MSHHRCCGDCQQAGGCCNKLTALSYPASLLTGDSLRVNFDYDIQFSHREEGFGVGGSFHDFGSASFSGSHVDTWRSGVGCPDLSPVSATDDDGDNTSFVTLHIDPSQVILAFAGVSQTPSYGLVWGDFAQLYPIQLAAGGALTLYDNGGAGSESGSAFVDFDAFLGFPCEDIRDVVRSPATYAAALFGGSEGAGLLGPRENDGADSFLLRDGQTYSWGPKVGTTGGSTFYTYYEMEVSQAFAGPHPGFGTIDLDIVYREREVQVDNTDGSTIGDFTITQTLDVSLTNVQIDREGGGAGSPSSSFAYCPGFPGELCGSGVDEACCDGTRTCTRDDPGQRIYHEMELLFNQNPVLLRLAPGPDNVDPVDLSFDAKAIEIQATSRVTASNDGSDPCAPAEAGSFTFVAVRHGALQGFDDVGEFWLAFRQEARVPAYDGTTDNDGENLRWQYFIGIDDTRYRSLDDVPVISGGSATWRMQLRGRTLGLAGSGDILSFAVDDTVSSYLVGPYVASGAISDPTSEDNGFPTRAAGTLEMVGNQGTCRRWSRLGGSASSAGEIQGVPTLQFLPSVEYRLTNLAECPPPPAMMAAPGSQTDSVIQDRLKGASKYRSAIEAGDVASEDELERRARVCAGCEHFTETRGVGGCERLGDGNCTACRNYVALRVDGELIAAGRARVGSASCPEGRWARAARSTVDG